jgi:hypothetical protein
MANDRGRQKKLEKQKKKRALARKQARDAVPVIPSAQASLIRAAAAWPIVGVHLGGHWRDASTPALVGALITRKMPNGQLFVASALVDRTCLGVKDAYAMRPLSRAEHAQLLEQTAEVYEVLEEVPIEVLRSVVFHAVDYAASLGFAPHEDFPASLFGPRPEPLLDTPWSNPPKPFYLSGPNDDVAAILAVLEARVGRDGFDVMVEGAPSFGAAGDEDDGGDDGGDDGDEAASTAKA